MDHIPNILLSDYQCCCNDNVQVLCFPQDLKKRLKLVDPSHFKDVLPKVYFNGLNCACALL